MTTLFTKPRIGKLNPAHRTNVCKQRAADKAEREEVARGLREVQWRNVLKGKASR